MSLAPRLDLRQSQSLVMTPQLQQAIKLLTLSNLEIEAFIGDALEANPLLEMGEVPARADAGERDEDGSGDTPETPREEREADALIAEGAAESDAPTDLSAAEMEIDRDTGDGSWGAAEGFGGEDDGFAIDSHGGTALSLSEYLHAQVGAASRDDQEIFVARALIERLDEAGYLTETLREVADALGVTLAEAERGLALLQSLDPAGVGARNLAECLAIQAREADRYDPCMARLIDNLELVARGDVARLQKLCEVDAEEFAEMLAELRGYDPRPGLTFGEQGGSPVVPDILIAPAHDGGWRIALNEATLPRLVVNRPYLVELRDGCRDRSSRAWLKDRLEDARWLIRALDQRQKTILAVASEIVTQQEGFFRHGVSHLRPLTLRQIAEKIEMHESTVSRVTSNKFLHCPRGTFDLKYFFTSGVGGGEDGEGASAAAVKARIKALTDAEDAKAILSDDKLVTLLKAEGFDIARRTVAKYREAMGIGSSVERRRAKKIAAIG